MASAPSPSSSSSSRSPLRILFVSLLLHLLLSSSIPRSLATGFLSVRHRFAGRSRSIADLAAHDLRRRGRALAAADLPLGGRGLPTDTGLYFTEIGIGTPSKSYYVQVDTGSDILWVNCITCNNCPKKSDLGVELTLYDPKSSQSANLVSCDESFCSSMYGGEIPECSSNLPCRYSVMYGDGSTTAGYFVTDYVQYGQVVGNHQTKQVNASISFGCGAQQTGDLGSSNEALDGILGFGQANSSMLSQLAASGKVKKIFAHCLDTINGGGIFAIGNVVQPKVNTTPLVPNQPHYNVNLQAIEVGGALLQLPSDLFVTGDKKGTIIDSGTTLSYLPEAAYKPMMNAVFANHQDLSLHAIQDFVCFQYFDNVDDGFPEIIFHFENKLSLNVYPHDYLFQNGGNVYCVGFQNGGMQSKDGKDMVLLGDLVLSNKLVLYDLENQVIGWTIYNCSSSIKVQDDKTGEVYTVNAQNISSGWRSKWGSSTALVLLTLVFCCLII
ncbi:aspartic proteinase-like protein 2 isoform X1 [Ananas comosus]|uniref:Aspartic proteinase-like protein 2 isoform X1 n=2 Tax=Ananas comosus TaxID=4615 RepID=A0A6P5H1I2_ANACO|nr:aspartic proteinase-like protein 2 isoform X1 [Ananas comosus]